MRPTDFIKLEDCIKGRVYKLHSRNLSHGVFDGEDGFIGIRLKWHDRFLATEYHYDTGAPHGTAYPLEEMCVLPEDIEPADGWRGEGPFTTNRKLFEFLDTLGQDDD